MFLSICTKRKTRPKTKTTRERYIQDLKQNNHLANLRNPRWCSIVSCVERASTANGTDDEALLDASTADAAAAPPRGEDEDGCGREYTPPAPAADGPRIDEKDTIDVDRGAKKRARAS